MLHFLQYYLPESASAAVLPTHLPRLPDAIADARLVHGYAGRTVVGIGHSLGGCGLYVLPLILRRGLPHLPYMFQQDACGDRPARALPRIGHSMHRPLYLCALLQRWPRHRQVRRGCARASLRVALARLRARDLPC